MNIYPILVGSIAVELSFNKTLEESYEICKDIDIIGNYDNIDINKIKNIDKISNKTTSNICDYVYGLEKVNIIKVKGYYMIICPLNVLYIMYKSHIHRVLQNTDSVCKNEEIWISKMFTYNRIREHLGYKYMDDIIYNKPDNPLSVLYYKQWNIMTNLYKDCDNMFDKDIDNFFKNDGLKRYVDHDIIHRYVAQHFRKTDELIFKRALLNEKDIEMDKDLFMGMSMKDKIQCIYEEICVLMIERPILIGNINLTFSYGNKTKYINHIISHFSTNLCGNKHHWLRIYVIDHVHIIYPKVEEEYDNLINIGINIIKKYVKEYNKEYINSLDNESKLLTIKFNNNNYDEYMTIEDCVNYVNENKIIEYIGNTQNEYTFKHKGEYFYIILDENGYDDNECIRTIEYIDDGIDSEYLRLEYIYTDRDVYEEDRYVLSTSIFNIEGCIEDEYSSECYKRIDKYTERDCIETTNSFQYQIDDYKDIAFLFILGLIEEPLNIKYDHICIE